MASSALHLFDGNVTAIAERIKFRLCRRGQSLAVYADPGGKVLVDNAVDPRLSRQPPDAWLVGIYTKRALIEHIEDDLLARARELTA